MNAEIITVGTELLLGDILNSNSQFLSRELAVYGINTLYQSTVGDNRERLSGALELALSRCDMVVLTGGLGPTEDDLTRETVAEQLHLPLVLHEESLARIRAYFESTGKEYTENNEKQARLPQGCTVFKNEHGTAPGCAVEAYGKCIILLPGPPRELIPMFSEQVVPYLAKFSTATIRSFTVGVYGIPESAVDERLADLMSGSNPTVAPYAKDGEVWLRVTAKAVTTTAAEALCEPVVQEIRNRLGTAVYGVDAGSLPKRVVELLRERGLKIATAESCTAGLLSGRLTEVSGASQVFECGVAAYSAEIKHQVLGVSQEILDTQGAVSPETAGAMAMGVRRVGGADIGIGITGVAGPDPSEGKPVGTVYVALADARRVWVKKLFSQETAVNRGREDIRQQATSYALDLARRYLEALPGVMAGGQTIEVPAEPTPSVSDKPKKEHGKRFFWLAALIVVLAALAVGAYVYLFAPYRNRKEFDELRALYTDAAVDSTVSGYPDGMLPQFASLYGINPHIFGWLSIDSTGINYPVVREPSEGYYQLHDFHNDTSGYGVPYVKSAVTAKAGMANRLLTVYGNNPDNGQMFSDLARYTELEFLKAHPTVTMSTLFQESEYKIFAVALLQDGDTDSTVPNIDTTAFESEDDFLYFAACLRQRSLFDTPVVVQEKDDLLLLTAPVDYRFDKARVVVAARRTRSNESRENDLSKARLNRSVQMPSAWHDSAVVTTATVTVSPSDEMTEPTTVATTESTTVQTTATTTKSKPKTTTRTVTSKRTTTTVPTDNREDDQLIGETTTKGTTTAPTTQLVTTAPTATPVKPATPVAGTVKGTEPETEYMAYFALKNTNSAVKDAMQDANGVLHPKTREELQRALTYIVKSELGSASTMVKSVEAQKAQAVASYTYILWYNSHYGTPYVCKLKPLNLNNTWDKKIYDAVGEVLGVKLLDTSKKTVISKLCQTSYMAATGGYSANSNRVWTSQLPYLKSVSSPYDNAVSYAKYGGTGAFVSTVTMTRDELYDKVRAWFESNVKNKYPTYTMPAAQFTTNDNELPLKALSYDGDGTAGKGDAWNYVFQTNFYYLDAKGNKKPLTGYNMRSALGLRSHAFRVTYEASTQTVTLTVQGWGHGVGFSQMGAVGYANEEGWNYVQILRHYYSVTDKSSHQIVLPVW